MFWVEFEEGLFTSSIQRGDPLTAFWVTLFGKRETPLRTSPKRDLKFFGWSWRREKSPPPLF
jgi:hypothetical protein